MPQFLSVPIDVAMELSEIRDSFWQSAEAAVRRMPSSPEAEDVLGFLKLNATLSYFFPQKPAPIEGIRAGAGAPFMTVFLRENDPIYSQKIRVFATAPEFCSTFYARAGLLVFKAWVPMTELWKGMLVLHEGFHAQTLIGLSNAEMESLDFHYAHERDTEEFELRVIRSIAGEPYASLVSECIEQTTDEIRSGGDDPGEAFTESICYPEAKLDEIFGPPLSFTERILRQTHFNVDVHFGIFDKLLTHELAQKKKAEYVRWQREKQINEIEGRFT